MWHELSIAIVFVLGCAWFAKGQEVSYTTDSLEEIKQKVESKEAILLDVREQDEWDEGHAKLATLLPMSHMKDETKRTTALEKLDKTKPIYCHCKMGGRAMMFAELVQDLGFDVRPVKYKYVEIAKSGLEIETSESK